MSDARGDDSAERRFLRTVSGEARGPGPAVARAALAIAEPPYRAAVAIRNKLFDWGLKRSIRVPRPVISVGNLTTGGTGKTPVVTWLARQFLASGARPAILTRGYRRSGASVSDEAEMLRDALGADVPILVNPDRAAAARSALDSATSVDVFIMDDGFQHRRLARDFDLVLIDATNPFGFGRVLPRGLLREPVAGLRRASAVLITRAQADEEALVGQISAVTPRVPVFRSSHELGALRSPAGRPVDRSAPVLAMAGIANPQAFVAMLRSSGISVTGTRFLADHHAYTAADVTGAVNEARRCGAGWIVTTEKDWVKLRPLVSGGAVEMQIAVAELSLRFHGDDSAQLFDLIRSRIARGRGA